MKIRSRRFRDSQAGTTLIELMISLVLASLVLFFVFAVHTRMTGSYRNQSNTAEVNAIAQAGAELLTKDIRMAGSMMPNGFRTANTAAPGAPNVMVPAIVVENNVDGFGPDAITMFFADSSRTVNVTGLTGGSQQHVIINDFTVFSVGDIVTLVAPSTVANPPGPDIVIFASCIVQITGLNSGSGQMQFSNGGSAYNTGPNAHCNDVFSQGAANMQVFQFTSIKYKIDPTRRAMGVLLRSTTGAMAPADFQEVGVGFVNLQFATRYFEDADGADLDGDGDDERDWYSSDDQNFPNVAPSVRPANSIPIQVALTIVVKSFVEVGGVATAAIPELRDISNVNNNAIGDFSSITLPGTGDPYLGNHIYRWTSSRIDLRNIGVGL